ncbi:MAG: hypothetical protein MZU79_04250 [Anaerotruncus sp.]|nr:hypothetical protein [Anaerotruncus sp.]
MVRTTLQTRVDHRRLGRPGDGIRPPAGRGGREPRPDGPARRPARGTGPGAPGGSTASPVDIVPADLLDSRRPGPRRGPYRGESRHRPPCQQRRLRRPGRLRQGRHRRPYRHGQGPRRARPSA